jgi:hypothetical protein
MLKLAWIGDWLPTFREKLWAPSSTVKQSKTTDCFALENRIDRLFRNVDNYESMLLTSKKSEDLIYTGTKAWNEASNKHPLLWY